MSSTLPRVVELRWLVCGGVWVLIAPIFVGCFADFDEEALCTQAEEGQSCGIGGVCRGGVCCAGCATATNGCETGDDPNSCGVAGAMCDVCEETERCEAGLCRPERRIESVVAGRLNNCVIDIDGALFCWGRNIGGGVGTGSDAGVAVPARVLPETRWKTVSVGWARNEHVCGIQEDGSAWCWGHNAAYQLGDGTAESRRVPGAVSEPSFAGDWMAISGGVESSCGVRGGALFCWGSVSSSGSPLDRAETDNGNRQTIPLRAGTGDDWMDVDLGEGAGCGQRGDRIVECWGDRGPGVFGSSPPADPSVPRRVSADFEEVSVSPTHACAISAGRILCWGENLSGQTGQPASERIQNPTPLDERTDWDSVSAGPTHACGIRGSGEMFCWGSNEMGQLGLGEEQVGALVLPPSEVAGNHRFESVAAGAQHTCGVSIEGTLLCWGDGGSSQLGRPGLDDASSPAIIVVP